ncbi:ribosome biogenesis GTPase Der [Desulforamulus hydrothermalis]|uniref:GTPase Der n=1 Tax=Desulforamulus hydrothermalis Lam5 = DSM 18033 TaxID=1121428 RepID=K8E0L4_9FIRM|nr:ribosome biogenesis GTPase Der [Desulforamulus hydrothermalis]CCO09025.1 GTPase involved in ribosome synthesis and maintenance [Desulforamulus hydrothermalis Lam5 = DSM 18033]SHG77225.1 GTP-binding protein [Desulforamulus hydrothermalis Lam5 = DSM 18033]
MAKPVVAIVGRPNVGKSTLFNRIVGARIAIVEDMPGVTRDRLYQDAEWRGQEFTLVDTGGLDFAEDVITSQIRKQAELAIKEADAVLFVVDAREGVTALDEEVARSLRKTDKPVLLVANKVEQFDKIPYYEFYQLGLGEPIPVSAAEGLNTGDLLDELVALLPPQEEDPYPPDTVRIAVIGRPNVGKSSLVNAILGEERVIVSNIPGTTRDAIDTPFERNGKNYVIIDTAGMRRRNRIDLPAERYSVVRALRAIDRCDVVLMVIDATEGVAEQDKKIVGYAHEKGKAIVLTVNKWDLIEKDDKTMNKFDKKIREELSFLDYAPTLYISALTKQRLPKVLETVDYAVDEASKRVATADLNNLIREATQTTPPPGDKHKKLKIFYATQGGVKPPTFILFVNEPELMHFSYRRYLENKIREAYGFTGTPIRFFLRKREAQN